MGDSNQIITAISLATAADARTISRLSSELVEYGLRLKYTEAKILQLIRSDSVNVAVAKNDQNLQGFGIMSYAENRANLDLLAVQKPFYGKGLARQLVSWLEAVALNSGILRVSVQARESNLRGIGFYKKLGYAAFDRQPRVYGAEAQVRMLKKLV